mgnify:CR=1 FL=1
MKSQNVFLKAKRWEFYVILKNISNESILLFSPFSWNLMNVVLKWVLSLSFLCLSFWHKHANSGLRCAFGTSGLRGKRLYCCFLDFKKAFDMVPYELLCKRMEELCNFLNLWEGYKLCMGDRISIFFNSTDDTNRLISIGLPLCIDELEQMEIRCWRSCRWECNCHALLYANNVVRNVVLFSLGDAQKPMRVLEKYYM